MSFIRIMLGMSPKANDDDIEQDIKDFQDDILNAQKSAIGNFSFETKHIATGVQWSDEPEPEIEAIETKSPNFLDKVKVLISKFKRLGARIWRSLTRQRGLYFTSQKLLLDQRGGARGPGGSGRRARDVHFGMYMTQERFRVDDLKQK